MSKFLVSLMIIGFVAGCAGIEAGNSERALERFNDRRIPSK